MLSRSPERLIRRPFIEGRKDDKDPIGSSAFPVGFPGTRIFRLTLVRREEVPDQANIGCAMLLRAVDIAETRERNVERTDWSSSWSRPSNSATERLRRRQAEPSSVI
jgi:hypothetical protein